jgi:SHS2 domain-containing protein
LRFNTIEHTADTGIEVEAESLEDLFAGAARAMFSIMVDLDGVEPVLARNISLQASDLAELMFRWLNELIFVVSADRLVLGDFEVRSVCDGRLEATVRGEEIDPAKHSLELEIKAATYHQMVVQEHGEGWYARVIFDV